MNRNRFIAFGLAALLCACTPTQWARPDVSAEQAEQDEIDCQRQAWHQANLRIGPYYGPFGRRYLGPPGAFFDPYGNRMLEEAQLADFCMRNKGYQRVPK